MDGLIAEDVQMAGNNAYGMTNAIAHDQQPLLSHS
jgi:hypothetical protein